MCLNEVHITQKIFRFGPPVKLAKLTCAHGIVAVGIREPLQVRACTVSIHAMHSVIFCFISRSG